MKKSVVLGALIVFCFQGLRAQDTLMPLWPKKVPNQMESNEREIHREENILRIANVQNPTLEVYLPSKENANGQAMLIFPGGGYRLLAYDWEGTDIAKFLNSKGVAGIVVKYRLPTSKSLIDKEKAPLQDAQRAIRLVRSHAKDWNLDEDKIGIIGFSAGGHLAATLGTHYDEEVYKKQNRIDSLGTKPNFMALVYPVITFKDEFTHKGSRTNLIGEHPTKELIEEYSNELHVTSHTPPTLLIHAEDDKAVPVENSLLFFEALREKEVPVTMHIYPKGGHGFSLALRNKNLRSWVDRLADWLQDMNIGSTLDNSN